MIVVDTAAHFWFSNITIRFINFIVWVIPVNRILQHDA